MLNFVSRTDQPTDTVVPRCDSAVTQKFGIQNFSLSLIEITNAKKTGPSIFWVPNIFIPTNCLVYKEFGSKNDFVSQNVFFVQKSGWAFKQLPLWAQFLSSGSELLGVVMSVGPSVGRSVGRSVRRSLENFDIEV